VTETMETPIEPANWSVVLVTFPDNTRFAAQRFGADWQMFGRRDALTWDELCSLGQITPLIEDQAASLAEALIIATANLEAVTEVRARVMAQPRIDEIQRTAAQRVREAEDDRDFQVQRVRDLNAELGRQLASLERQRDRLYAQVKRVDALWRSLPAGGEFEQRLRAALHPAESSKATNISDVPSPAESLTSPPTGKEIN